MFTVSLLIVVYIIILVKLQRLKFKLVRKAIGSITKTVHFVAMKENRMYV